MSDVEKELRDMLRDKADEVVIETDIPGTVLKKARRRRVLNAALAGGLTVLVVAGGLVGANALLGPARTERPGGQTTAPPAPGAWPDVIWPELTREEAEARQAEVDAGSEDYDWQLAPQSLLYTYGQQVWSWERVHFITSPDGVADGAEVTIGSCAEQTGEAQGGACEFRRVTVEQLLGTGAGMLWFVTADERGDPNAGGGGGGGVSREVATTTINEIMRRRLDGQSVDQWLTPDSEALYDSHTGGLYLFDGDHPNGEPQQNWVGSMIVSLTEIDGDQWRAVVRVERAGFEGSGGYFEETLTLGRGQNVLGEYVDLLIRNAAKSGGTDGETRKQCQAGSPTPVRDCARSFMQTRIDGAGAEFYMTQDARNVYDDPNNQLHLYGTPYEDSGNFEFDRYEILGIRQADANSYEVDVRLHVVAEGGPLTIFETLFVGPGRNANDELQDWVVRGAEGHYED